MKITEDVREYAAKQNVVPETALVRGMEEKAKAFREKGNELYVEGE
jgi:phosphomethylpyrimidine synthase